jgi:hypothetical protein
MPLPNARSPHDALATSVVRVYPKEDRFGAVTDATFGASSAASVATRSPHGSRGNFAPARGFVVMICKD